jgi:hypothetical protein
VLRSSSAIPKAGALATLAVNGGAGELSLTNIAAGADDVVAGVSGLYALFETPAAQEACARA